MTRTETATDQALVFAIRELKRRRLKVMLKPHVDAMNGVWRGNFNPTDPDAWFRSYTDFILHYAQLAQAEGVDGLVLGTEFKTLTTNRDHDARWSAVIRAIRDVYGGALTYAANAAVLDDEYTAVGFWAELDTIGLDAYFALSNTCNPTLGQLLDGWAPVVPSLRDFTAAHANKSLLLTELGFRSVDCASTRPWDHSLTGPRDLAEQRDSYEATFTAWHQETGWMIGAFWWAWPVPPPSPTDTDYTPRRKPAEQVLRSWFGPASIVRFGRTAYSAREGRKVRITVRRTGGRSGRLIVPYATRDATATVDDYGAESGTLVFEPNVVQRSFTVTIHQDTIVEGTETFEVVLGPPIGGGLLETPNTAAAAIVDDDRGGTLRLSASSYAVREGRGAATITVLRTGGGASDVTVDYSTTDGTATTGVDFVSSSGTLRFGAGETRKTFPVPLIDDAVRESTETFGIVLSNPGGGGALGARSLATVAISDNPGVRLVAPPDNGAIDLEVAFGWQRLDLEEDLTCDVITDKGVNPFDGGHEDRFSAGTSESLSVMLDVRRYYSGVRFEWGVVCGAFRSDVRRLIIR